MITQKELIRDTVATHGLHWTAKHFSKRIPFAIFYWLAFGRAPRSLRMPPVNEQCKKRTALHIAQWHVTVSLHG